MPGDPFALGFHREYVDARSHVATVRVLEIPVDRVDPGVLWFFECTHLVSGGGEDPDQRLGRQVDELDARGARKHLLPEISRRIVRVRNDSNLGQKRMTGPGNL